MKLWYGLGASLLALSAYSQADVIVQGHIKGGIATHKEEGTGTITRVEDYRSKITFKGNEQLDAGNELFWQVESALSIAGAQQSGGWNSYDTFIGVKNADWGSVRLGYTPDGMLGGGNQKPFVDPWESNLDMNDPKGLKIFSRAEKRLQGVRYDMPHTAGFDLNITHQLADGANTSDTDARTVVNQATVLAAGYKTGPWYAKTALGQYKHQFVANGNVEDANLVRVLAGYDDKTTLVGLGFQYMDGFQGLWSRKAATADVRLTPAVETKEALINVSHKIGRFTPRATYVHGWDEKHAAGKVGNTSYDQVIIGGDYALSKQTTVLLSAGWKESPYAYKVAANGKVSGEKDTVYSVGLGLRHWF